MNRWARYPRILGICWRAAISTELEYRLNFAASAVLSAFWMAWVVAGTSVYFQFTKSVAGWTYPELLVVVGLFFTINGLRQALFQPNLDRMTEYVRRGTLDFLLTKPVDAQLLVSLRYLSVSSLLDPLLGLILAFVGLALSGHGVGAAALASFAWMLTAAVLLLYGLMLALMALAVRLVGSEGLDALSFGVVELSRFPVQLYRDPLQTVLTVVPVAFLTTLPAHALLGQADPLMLLVSTLTALASVALATLLWRRCLRSYTGASA